MATGSNRTANSTVSAHNAVAVTASDTTHLFTTRGLYVGGAGNVAVVMADADLSTTAGASEAQAVDVIFVGVTAGSVLPIQVVRVLSTGTTATSIVALY